MSRCVSAIVPAVAVAACASAASAATVPADGARQWAAAFGDVCLRTRSDPTLAQAAIAKLGWKGRVLQRGGGETPFTYWQFPFGELWFGYSMIAGINLKTFSCTLSIKAPGAPPRAELEAALAAELGSVRFQNARNKLGTFTRVARLKDREDEQELVTFVGNKIAMRVAQGFELRRGIFIDYSYTKGAHARELKGH